MCGKYVLDDGSQIDIIKLLKLIESKVDISKLSLNEIYPSNTTIILNENFEPMISKWGYKKWDNKGILINARSETLLESVFFNSKNNKKCLIVASGFYEFKEKRPYYFYSSSPIFMAGIYNENNEFVILTKEAKNNVLKIHHRSPIVMDKNNAVKYLKNFNYTNNITMDEEIYMKLAA
jgi:putative SOS response-associated peptidase YedK